MPDADITDILVQLPNATGWKYTTADGTVETYDATGKRTSFTNRAGLTQTLAYDANGRLTTVTDPFGRQLTFTPDSQNRIAAMTDPAGGVYTYAYDANNNLVSVTYPDGKTRGYLYENPTFKNALTGILDENGTRYATYAYDNTGRAISSEHAGGGIDKHSLSYTTDANGNPISTTATDPLGTARTYNFTTILGVVKSTGQSQPGGSGCGPASSAQTYDANGNVASRTDFNGNVTTYAYDLARNLETSRTEAYGKPQARTVTTVWHAVYRLPTQISEPGRTTAFSYDANGNLLQKTITAGSQTRAWTYTYNAWGQVLTANGPRTDVTDVTSYTYDAQGNLATVTDALGHVTQIIAYDANGRPLTILDPNLVATQLSYDARGRLTRRAVENDVTNYVYDGVGQLVQLTQPDGAVLTYTYDPAHRLIAISDGQGNRIAYTLDAMGNRLKEDVTDPAGQLARTRSQAFDALGRLAQVLDSQNHATRFTYDANGNLAATTDANGNQTTSSYDALNRLIQSLDPLGGATRTQYDPLDQVTRVIDPKNVATTYAVTGMGDVTSESSPDSGTTASSYDSAGNLLSRSDASGITLSYTYDALNRLTRIGNANGPLISYTWDGPTLGKLARFQDLSGSTAYQYDPYGRLSVKTQTQGSLAQNVSYAYAPGNRLSRITTPGGNQIGYAYAGGKIASVTVNALPLLSNISYEPHGPVSGWTWGNGLPHIRVHGLDGEVRHIESAVDQAFSYDAAGQLDQVHLWNPLAPTQGDTVNSYGYDAGGRLIQASTTGPYAATLAYAYDANGNRTSLIKNWSQAAYAYSANRLTQLSGTFSQVFQYDGAGRLISDGFFGYAYDALGRLSSVSGRAGSVASYRYNALGQRVAKDSPSGSIRFVYDEGGHLLGEYDTQGKPIQELVWLDELPVASMRPKSSGVGVDVYYIHPDHLGTPRQITDSINRIVWRWNNSDPFGANYPDEDADGDGFRFEFNLRFPGQYFDRETGRHYNYFRDYDPGTGRYTTSDPIGLEGGPNRYTYVGGNPLSFSDPLGLCPWCGGAAGGSAGVGGFGGLGGFGMGGKSGSGNKDDGSHGGLFPPGTMNPSKSKQCDDDNGDDCKQKATDWELEQAGINAHEVKKGLGQVSLFEICKCKSGGFAVKRKGCQGPIIYRL